MNKVAAEIIAGVIPHKMTRNRWRGILRYGIINAINIIITIFFIRKLLSSYITVEHMFYTKFIFM